PQILKRVLHTSAMMGVRHLFLIRSARVEKSYFSSPLLQPQKMFSYLREGLEQGVSTILPQVSLHQRFRGFLEEELPRATEQTSCALLAEPSAEQSLWALARSRGFRNGENALLAVGPEGGWQDHEVAAFRDHGFAPFHCGPRVLRVDAAVCSLLGQIDLLRHLGGHC
ncbi:MAG TPA: RsmE family RNA methyltransferase, partial [Oligoflexia bacterium]|nr:RsmE family RNA methyltransferase [Oligoflexia bacterium]